VWFGFVHRAKPPYFIFELACFFEAAQVEAGHGGEFAQSGISGRNQNPFAFDLP